MIGAAEPLPIYAHEDEILEAVGRHRVVVIEGATGWDLDGDGKVGAVKAGGGSQAALTAGSGARGETGGGVAAIAIGDELDELARLPQERRVLGSSFVKRVSSQKRSQFDYRSLDELWGEGGEEAAVLAL